MIPEPLPALACQSTDLLRMSCPLSRQICRKFGFEHADKDTWGCTQMSRQEQLALDVFLAGQHKIEPNKFNLFET